MEIADFPWSRIPKVSRRTCAELRRAARRLPRFVPDAALTQLGVLLGATPQVTPAPIEVCPEGALRDCVTDPLIALILATGPGPNSPRFAVELDARLAACIVDRALGGHAGPGIAAPHGALPDLACGVLDYLAARLAAAYGGSVTLELRGTVTTPAALAHAVGDAGCLVWPAHVTLGSDHGVIRAWIPDMVVLPSASRLPQDVPWLQALLVRLTLEGGTTTLATTELASLGPGDVVMVEHTRLRLRGTALEGFASVRAAGAGAPRWNAVVRDQDLILHSTFHGELPHMAHDSTNPDPLGAALAVVGDAPVDVRIELARVALTLSEIAELRPGEVLVTGRELGAEVILRAGERAIATGELVDVEGELGVRILRVGG